MTVIMGASGWEGTQGAVASSDSRSLDCTLLHNHLYLEGLKEEPIKHDLLWGSNCSPRGQAPSIPNMTVLQAPSDTVACVKGH